MIVIVVLTLLIGGGATLFHSLEKWTWIESFYFTVSTITTVGYGDIAPTNDNTRLAVTLYILFGVVIGVAVIRYLVGAIVVKTRAAHNHDTKNHQE